MKQLLLNEIFYSIQGEGYWTGTPMVFIRLAGCNLSCYFCDTDNSVQEKLTPKKILKEVRKYPATRVCITGGEPTLQNLYPLVELLKDEGYQIHIETNGTREVSIPTLVDWITFSPKFETTPMPLYTREVKLLCGPPGWERLADSYKSVPNAILWVGLQPIATNYEKPALRYCLANPVIRYSMQIHKKLKGVK